MIRSVAGLRVAVVMALAGCVVVPASDVKTSRQLSAPVTLDASRKVAVLFSPDFSPETPRSIGRDMVECVRVAVREGAPEVGVVGEEQFFAAVFPDLRPEQVMLRAEAIPLLAGRAEIRHRLERAGIAYLLMVGGRVEREGHGGLGPALIVAWSLDKRARMGATLFDLRRGESIASGRAEAAGSMFFLAPLLIPMGGGVDPEGPTCRALGSEVVRLLRDPAEDASR